MSAMIPSKRTTAAVPAIAVALLTLLVCYWTFRWGFIRIWERQHEGRRIVFAFGPETSAAALALLSSIAVFLAVFMYSLRRGKT
jgi:hypothetical protein